MRDRETYYERERDRERGVVCNISAIGIWTTKPNCGITTTVFVAATRDEDAESQKL